MGRGARTIAQGHIDNNRGAGIRTSVVWLYSPLTYLIGYIRLKHLMVIGNIFRLLKYEDS